MRRMLSSHGTILLQIVMPLFTGFLFINTIILCFQPESPEGLFAVVLVLGVFFGVTIHFAWRLCFATADSQNLYVWTFRGSDVVPLGNLKSVVAVSRARTPRIELEFDPPTKFGNILTIVPPVDLSKEGLWTVYEFLSGHASKADHDAETPGKGSAWSPKVALLVWLVIVLTIIGLFLMAP